MLSDRSVRKNPPSACVVLIAFPFRQRSIVDKLGDPISGSDLVSQPTPLDSAIDLPGRNATSPTGGKPYGGDFLTVSRCMLERIRPSRKVSKVFESKLGHL